MTATLTPPTVDRHAREGRQWGVLLGLLAASGVVAFLGGLASVSGVDGWYAQADKPAWTPPNWVFGPVWTVLYVLMAVAAWLVWRRWGLSGPTGAKVALALYALQLVLNGLWTPAFFGAELLELGAVIIIALDVVLVLTVAEFWRRHRLAAVLLLPYLAWCLYATSLNIGIALLN